MEIVKRWWKITIQNTEDSPVAPGRRRSYEFPSPDQDGAEKIARHDAESFPGYGPHTQITLVDVTDNPWG